MQGLEEFLNTQTTYRRLMLSILDVCKTERTINIVLDFIKGYPAVDNLALTPVEILSILKDYNSLSKRYDEEAGVEYWKTTSEGLLISEKFDAVKALLALIDNSPKFAKLFKEILNFCKDGRQMGDIDKTFSEHKSLDGEILFPSYFVNELERAGGICWHGNVWKTTDVGLKFL